MDVLNGKNQPCDGYIEFADVRERNDRDFFDEDEVGRPKRLSEQQILAKADARRLASLPSHFLASVVLVVTFAEKSSKLSHQALPG